MNPCRHFRDSVLGVIEGLAAEGALPAGLDTARVTADAPSERELGDITTNAAMVLAKPAGMNPKDLAALLVPRLEALDHVAGATSAGPGFINLRLEDAFWHGRLAEILAAGSAYGASNLGRAEAVNVEFASDNPTGPLHVGHARGAVVGDALAALLEKAGYLVTREYYINDAGAQVEALARSLHLRYAQALGDDGGEPPEGFYPGEYLIPVAAALVERDGNKWQNMPEDDWLEPFRQVAVEAMMDLIREDLAALGVRFDVFSSERALACDGAVERALEHLEARNLIYMGVLEPPKGKASGDWEPRPQTLFKSTEFGDDVDRPIRKSDGSWTYFATDMAYHLDKYRRGFKSMIDVFGVDHGGYVKRLTAAVKALTDGEGSLDVKLCALVNLLDGGNPVKMSKRAGTFVTLGDVIDKVGKDVVRFIMLTRKNDQPLDFDLAQVTEKSRDNLVFYVQYAHARVCSVMRHAADTFDPGELSAVALARADASRLTDPAELDLIKAMAGWPQVVEAAARGPRTSPCGLLPGRSRGPVPRPLEQGQGRRALAFHRRGRPPVDGGQAGPYPGPGLRHRVWTGGVRRHPGRGNALMTEPNDEGELEFEPLPRTEPSKRRGLWFIAVVGVLTAGAGGGWVAMEAWGPGEGEPKIPLHPRLGGPGEGAPRKPGRHEGPGPGQAGLRAHGGKRRGAPGGTAPARARAAPAAAGQARGRKIAARGGRGGRGGRSRRPGHGPALAPGRRQAPRPSPRPPPSPDPSPRPPPSPDPSPRPPPSPDPSPRPPPRPGSPRPPKCSPSSRRKRLPPRPRSRSRNRKWPATWSSWLPSARHNWRSRNGNVCAPRTPTCWDGWIFPSPGPISDRPRESSSACAPDPCPMRPPPAPFVPSSPSARWGAWWCRPRAEWGTEVPRGR